MREILFGIRYGIKWILRQRQFAFWMFAYPMILLTIFFFVFSGIDKGANIDIALGIEKDSGFTPLLKQIHIIDLVEADEDERINLLEEGKLQAYLTDDYELVVADSSMSSSTLASVLDSVKQYSLAYMLRGSKERGMQIPEDIILGMELKDIEESIMLMGGLPKDGQEMSKLNENIDSKMKGGSQKTGVLIVIMLAAFSMYSVYGLYSGVQFSSLIQANLSPVAGRIGISPFRKVYIVISAFMVSLIFSLLLNSALIIYVTFILGVKLFTNVSLTFLVIFIASIFATSTGILLGMSTRLTQKQKPAIVTITTLLLTFMTGLTGGTDIRWAIERNVPILNRINPIVLVNEMMYKINIIGSSDGLLKDLITLLAFGIISLILATLSLRRENYDSL